jgi:hypothetical protein
MAMPMMGGMIPRYSMARRGRAQQQPEPMMGGATQPTRQQMLPQALMSMPSAPAPMAMPWGTPMPQAAPVAQPAVPTPRAPMRGYGA